MKMKNKVNAPIAGGLKALLGICGLATILCIVAVVVQLSGNVFGDRLVDVSISANDLTIAEADDDFRPIDVLATVTASANAYLVASIGRAVAATSAGIIAVMLALALNSARLGDPFVAKNARRLRIAALATIPGFAGMGITTFGHLMATDDAGLVPQATISFAWVVAFIILAALSEIWTVGVQLREDISLTV